MSTFKSMAEFYERYGSEEPNYSAPLKTCAKLIKVDAKRRFDLEQDPDGKKWKAHALATLMQRDKKTLKRSAKARKKVREGKGLSHKILQDDGALRRSVASNGPGHIEEVTPTMLVIGTSDPIAGVHQAGTNKAGKSRKVKIPQRRIIGFGKKLLSEIQQVFVLYRKRRMEGVG